MGLLSALYALRGQNADAGRLARLACEIEINRLGEPIGKQDQYIAAYGGIQFIQFGLDPKATKQLQDLDKLGSLGRVER